MSPRRLGEQVIRRVPLLRLDQSVGSAVEEVVRSGLPSLPVVDAEGRFRGIFGEREFVGALFPAYLGELSYAAFVTEEAATQMEKRAECRDEPVSKHLTVEHVEVSPEWSDAQIAEIFLHHRVLIIPVVRDGEVQGVVTRSDFFKALAGELLGD